MPFNQTADEVRTRMNNYIPLFYQDVISYQGLDLDAGLANLSK